MNSKYIVILGTPPARIDATEEIMTAIREAVGESDLTGFTLFPVKAGYQLSTRRKNEDGWIVKIVTDEWAIPVLAMLDGGVEKPTERYMTKREQGVMHKALLRSTRLVEPSFEASLDAAAEALQRLRAAIEGWTPA